MSRCSQRRSHRQPPPQAMQGLHPQCQPGALPYPCREVALMAVYLLLVVAHWQVVMRAVSRARRSAAAAQWLVAAHWQVVTGAVSRVCRSAAAAQWLVAAHWQVVTRAVSRVWRLAAAVFR